MICFCLPHDSMRVWSNQQQASPPNFSQRSVSKYIPAPHRDFFWGTWEAMFILSWKIALKWQSHTDVAVTKFVFIFCNEGYLTIQRSLSIFFVSPMKMIKEIFRWVNWRGKWTTSLKANVFLGCPINCARCSEFHQAPQI